MAYQYQEGLALNTADFIKKLRDFVVTTTGWTSVQDTVGTTGASGSYFVASSTGESGNDRNFVRFIRQNANAVTALGYLSWAAGSGKVLTGSTSSSAGVGTYVTADDNSPFWYWIFGSLDRIVIFTQTGSRIAAMDSLYIGSYSRQRSTAYRAITNNPAAGTGVVLNMADTTIFAVGRRYTIADDNNFESPKVTAINPGVSVTVDALANSYTAANNLRIGDDPRPLLVTAQSSFLGLGALHWLTAPPMRASLGIAANVAALPSSEFGLRTVDISLIERIGIPDGGPDGGGGSAGGLIDMWPIFLADESMFSGGLLGTLTEVYAVPRTGIVTDDTITVGGSTYRYVNPAPDSVATAQAGPIGIAVRQS